MINQEILDYIKNQLAAGHNEEEIRLKLSKVGWLKEDIDQALKNISDGGDNALNQEASIASEDEVESTPPLEEEPYTRPTASSIMGNEDTPNDNIKESSGSLRNVLILFAILLLAIGGGLAAYFIISSDMISMPTRETALEPEEIATRAFINLIESPDLGINSENTFALKNRQGEIIGSFNILANIKTEKKLNDIIGFNNIEAVINIDLNLNIANIENSLPELLITEWEKEREEILSNAGVEINDFFPPEEFEKLLNSDEISLAIKLEARLLEDDLFLKLDNIQINNLSLLDKLPITINDQWIEIKDFQQALNQDPNTQKLLTNVLNIDYAKMVNLQESQEIDYDGQAALSFDYEINEQYIDEILRTVATYSEEELALLKNFIKLPINNIVVAKDDYQVLESSTIWNLTWEDLERNLDINIREEFNTEKEELILAFREEYPDLDLSDEEIEEIVEELEELITGLNLEISSISKYNHPTSPFSFTRPTEAIDIMELMMGFFMGGMEQIDTEDPLSILNNDGLKIGASACLEVGGKLSEPSAGNLICIDSDIDTSDEYNLHMKIFYEDKKWPTLPENWYYKKLPPESSDFTDLSYTYSATDGSTLVTCDRRDCVIAE